MKSLYIINDPNKLSEALPFIAEDDAILLIEDAVVLATNDSEHTNCTNQYALEEDLIARGLKGKNNASWMLVDHPRFVELTLAFDKSITWL